MTPPSSPSGIKFATSPAAFGHRQDQSFQEFIKVAQLAEELGYDGVFMVDHFFLAPDRMLATTVDLKRPYQLECWTALAALAATTKKVRLGPMVTPISLRHPSFIAKMAANIDVISNGRLVLPVGTGWNEREYTGFSFPYDKPFSVRYQKMIEGVEIIKKFWTEDDWVSYEGQYYKLDRAPFWPKPFQKPHPPIWFGGSGAKTRRAVAKYGDGWSPAGAHYVGFPPEIYREGFQEICAIAQAEGRDPSKITPAFCFNTVIAKDRKEALRKAEILHQRSDWASIPMEELRQRGAFIGGSPDDCVEQLQRYVDAGVRYFKFTPIPVDLSEHMKVLELYSEKVIPHFKGR